MNLIAAEIHKPQRKIKEHRKVKTFYRNHVWGADLVEMIPYANENENFKYILTIVDVYSKFAYAVPLKNKTAESVTNAFKYIIDTTGFKPEFIWTDLGKEFYNSKLDDLRKKHNIGIYSTFGNSKSAIVERFNKTLKSKIWQIFTQEQNKNWIDILNDLVQKYNQTKHSAVEFNKPKDMMFDDIRLKIKEDKRPVKKPKFKLNDRVRVSLKKGVFQKAYEGNWSQQIYKICEIIESNPINYKLKDEETNEIIKGSWYEQELQLTKQKEGVYFIHEILKTKLVKGVKMCLVKWTGYDNPTWEPENNIKHFKDFNKL